MISPDSRLLVLIGLLASFACGDATPATSPDSPSVDDASVDALPQFAGAWSLARVERRNADGDLEAPPTEDRLGYLIYDGAGHMGVTIMRPDRTPYSGGEPTADEALALYGTYTSYFGRYSVDEAEGVVTHHLEGSLNPSGAGSDYRRYFTFAENSLTLQPPERDDGGKSFLTWERLPDLPASELTQTHRQLCGAFEIESVTRHTTDGYEVPAEQYEAGYIMYAPSGHMSVHLARGGRTPFAATQPTAAEALHASDTYASYFGPFSVNELAGCITCPGPRDQGYLVHHRVGSETPSGSGTDAQRYYELTDTHLTLRPPPSEDDDGRQVVSAIRWRRLSPPND